jgi:hypothetical protein
VRSSGADERKSRGAEEVRRIEAEERESRGGEEQRSRGAEEQGSGRGEKHRGRRAGERKRRNRGLEGATECRGKTGSRGGQVEWR